MRMEKAAVLRNEEMGLNHYRIALECGSAFDKAEPGQFIMLHLTDGDGRILPRPFSIHRLRLSDTGCTEVQILYRVVGAVTEKMSRLDAGSLVQVVGPLGRGFSLPEGVSRPMIVAGGIGVAPLVFLVEIIIKSGINPDRIRFFLGAKNRDELLCHKELEGLKIDIGITTDDGSHGQHCLVTHPFQLSAKASPPDIIYACGPESMLQCVAPVAISMKIPCQVSIEALMACGFGVCLGCAVEGNIKDRYLHVCKDGPVFDAKDLRWE